jgi:hypothetical protein
MKKLSKIVSILSTFIFGFFMFAHNAIADVILPGEEKQTRPGLITKNELITYGVIAGVIFIAIVVSFIVLMKIRKSNVNK